MTIELVVLALAGGFAGAYLERWYAGWQHKRRLKQETLRRRVTTWRA